MNLMVVEAWEWLLVHHNQGARVVGAGGHLGLSGRNYGVSPVKQLFGLAGFQINTAVAHGLSKIVVPISAMQRITGVEVHGIRDFRQVIIGAGHQRGRKFPINFEFAQNRGRIWQPGGSGE